jgi:hypothetical protein
MFPAISSLDIYSGPIFPPRNIEGVRHYNPGMCRHKGRDVICWRVEDAIGMSYLAAGELRGNRIVDAVRLATAATAEGYYAEDPRILTVGGVLHVVYAQATYSVIGWSVRQAVATLSDSLQVTSDIVPSIGGNGWGIVKNWIPYEHDGRLCIKHWPLKDVDGMSHGNWPFGMLSGRSQGIPWGEKMLCLVGGHIPHSIRQRRYYLSLMTFDPVTQRPLEASEMPFVWASDDDPAIACPKDPQYNPCVVFASGLTMEPDNDTLQIVAGIHDSSLIRLTISMKKQKLKPIGETFSNRIIATPGQETPNGYVTVRVTKQPINEHGMTYLPGDTFLVTKERAEQIAQHVEIVLL